MAINFSHHCMVTAELVGKVLTIRPISVGMSNVPGECRFDHCVSLDIQPVEHSNQAEIVYHKSELDRLKDEVEKLKAEKAKLQKERDDLKLMFYERKLDEITEDRLRDGAIRVVTDPNIKPWELRLVIEEIDGLRKYAAWLEGEHGHVKDNEELIKQNNKLREALNLVLYDAETTLANLRAANYPLGYADSMLRNLISNIKVALGLVESDRAITDRTGTAVATIDLVTKTEGLNTEDV